MDYKLLHFLWWNFAHLNGGINMKIFTLKWWFPKKRLSARAMRGPPLGYQSRATKYRGFEANDEGSIYIDGVRYHPVWKDYKPLTPEQKAEQEITELARQKAVLRQQQDDEYGNFWAWLVKPKRE